MGKKAKGLNAGKKLKSRRKKGLMLNNYDRRYQNL